MMTSTVVSCPQPVSIFCGTVSARRRGFARDMVPCVGYYSEAVLKDKLGRE